jgi:hypothetical protein
MWNQDIPGKHLFIYFEEGFVESDTRFIRLLERQFSAITSHDSGASSGLSHSAIPGLYAYDCNSMYISILSAGTPVVTITLGVKHYEDGEWVDRNILLGARDIAAGVKCKIDLTLSRDYKIDSLTITSTVAADFYHSLRDGAFKDEYLQKADLR